MLPSFPSEVGEIHPGTIEPFTLNWLGTEPVLWPKTLPLTMYAFDGTWSPFLNVVHVRLALEKSAIQNSSSCDDELPSATQQPRCRPGDAGAPHALSNPSW
jgi:hypothetical protein